MDARAGSLLIAVSLLLSPISAVAGETKNAPLVPQEAALDNSKPQTAPENTAGSDNGSRMLSGAVTKIDQGEQSDEVQIHIGGCDTITVKKNSAAAQLNEQRAQDLADLMKASKVFKLFLGSAGSPIFQLKSRTPQMSSEQFRKLEYGVIGLDAVLQVNGAGPVIRTLYPSCPAANAGMRPGDRIIQAQDHVFQPGEGQRVLWHIVGGKAGTPVDITVLRNGELIPFHLVRMNIEDIENVGIRRMYENLLSALGPPSYQPGNNAVLTPDDDDE